MAYSSVAQEQVDNDETAHADEERDGVGASKDPEVLNGFCILTFIGDCLLVLLPISFLVLAIAAYRLDEKPISKYGKKVQSAMTLGPTIYPLMFAALGGRSLRGLAVWLAECGTTIEVLEKLMGSQTFIGALGTAITLRSANILTILLLLLWSLSPIGGQSTLRLLRESNSTTTTSSTVYFAAPEAPFVLQHASPWYSVVPTILTASLAASAAVKGGPVDLWTHPKVPRLRPVESASVPTAADDNDWIPVNNSTFIDYSSWTGVNIQGLQLRRRAQFQIQYNYITLDCTLRLRDKPTTVLNHLTGPSTYIYNQIERTNNSLRTLLRSTLHLQGADIPFDNSYFLRYGYNSTSPTNATSNHTLSEGHDTQDTFHFLYGTYSFYTENFHVFECKPQLVTVEAHIDCQSASCIVDRMRRVPNRSGLENSEKCNVDIQNRLACLQKGSLTLNTFISFLPTLTSPYATPYTPSGRSVNFTDPFDDFIFSGAESYTSDSVHEDRNWDIVSTDLISQRLTILLNTYWQAASWGGLITRSRPFSVPQIPTELHSYERYDVMNDTEATITRQMPVYKANLPWIYTLLFTTTVLLILGDFHLVVSVATTAPDIFSYAASLTRENPYTTLANKGSALRGTDRARLLRKMKVQVADVRPDEDVGYIALRSVEHDSELRNGLITKGKPYL